MRQVVKRLLPGQDLKAELINLARVNHIQSGCVISGVGSFTHARVRTAAENGKETYVEWDEHMEIVSITGTISEYGQHVHLSFSDINGNTYGGHLAEGCRVFTVVEIVILVFDDMIFEREFDKVTGFKELKVSNK